MNDSHRAGLISRRDAIGLFAATPALGADAALSNVLGGTALVGASVLGVDAAAACGGAARDLSQLSPERFEALLGETFTLGDTTATLRDVRRGPDTPFRQQFAMIFETAPGASIASAVAAVSHPAIGQHDLFVTQISGDGRGALEICFS